MKSVPTLGVQPAVLLWARQTVGLTVDAVAHRLKRTPDEIESWEDGSGSTTYSQLEKLAYELYRRPLALFFLPQPPEEDLPQQEFRSLPESDLRTLLPDTRLRIRSAHAYQLALNELFSGKNPVRDAIWDRVRLTADGPVIDQAEQVRTELGITVDEQVSWNNSAMALKEWRRAVEHCGIYVFKWAFKQKDISGLSLQDSEFPIIYLYNSNAKTRQAFSLFHELAHILLNTNGVCKDSLRQTEDLPQPIKKIEQFCNKIAAEVLVPTSDFVRVTRGLPDRLDSAGDQIFEDLAGRYSVSREVILRRFVDSGRLDRSHYEGLVRRWVGETAHGDGGNYYATVNAYLSPAFALEVVRQRAQQRISEEHAARLLGVKATSLVELEQRIRDGAVA